MRFLFINLWIFSLVIAIIYENICISLTKKIKKKYKVELKTKTIGTADIREINAMLNSTISKEIRLLLNKIMSMQIWAYTFFIFAILLIIFSVLFKSGVL